jgi:hypothetical protein
VVAYNAVDTTLGGDQTFTTTSGDTGGVSVLTNGHFASGTSSWTFYTNGSGSFSVGSDGERAHVANLHFTTVGNNMQLYQSGIPLESGETYRLSFEAKSSTGHDVHVYLQKHVTPYTAYGLDQEFNIGTTWGTHQVEFVAQNFSGTVNDGRLYFWFVGYAAAGDDYYLDTISLVQLTGLGKQGIPMEVMRPIPTQFLMAGNYPNPFNPSTTIEYQLPSAAFVNLKIYDVLGRQIAELVSGMKEAGYYSVRWIASSAPSGIYYARFTVTDEGGKVLNTTINKLLLVK